VQVRIRAAALVVGCAFVGLLAGGGVAPGAAQAPLSAHCHVVDGLFTTCPDGSGEWSDVPSHFFAETNAYLYADQADLDATLAGPKSAADTFELMYDECAQTTPLGPNEYFLIGFDTVEEEDGGENAVERYAVHVFSDGTIIFLENGEVVPDDNGRIRATEIEGQHGKAGFGASPTCSTPHLVVEFDIPLTATGIKLNGGYSPDPIFWGATPPKLPPVANDDEGNLEDKDSVTVPVVSNDTDADDPIVPSSVVVVAPPAHGTAVANGDGTITFTKDDSFKREDTLSYTVNDEDGLTSNTAKVDILRPCSKDVGASIDDKSSPAAAGKLSKKGTDVDKDGLKSEVEKQLGTDPCHYDTDGDGLADPWEVSGVAGAGFDLNGDGSADVSGDQVFGAAGAPNPLRKDVYVEVDEYDCAISGCPPLDPMVHDLAPEAITGLKSMFAALPAQNPSGSAPGVNLHLQVDEHIAHTPNCAQPPNDRSHFGTIDQRANGNIIQGKALAFRYVISGHSTLFPSSTSCPTPTLPEIVGNMLFASSALPAYDNTPFGRATVGGSDIMLSLSPVWICPRYKIIPTGLIKPFLPFWLQPLVPNTITPCDRESYLDPGIFPTTVPTSSGNKPLSQPYSRGLGRAIPGNAFASEQNGIIQLQGRALAHLLGHSLGLSSEAAVANDPQLSTPPPGNFWPPDPYSGVANLTYAKSLVDLLDSGDHLMAIRTGNGSATAAELDVFGNPIEDFLNTDRDGDGVIERLDNCTGVNNPGQEDLDSDGVGDPCDRDIDGDLVDNADDAHPSDTDNDGVDNAVDPDDDGDTVPDTVDNCALTGNGSQQDTDHDGAGDACDSDSDNDGVLDPIEVNTGSNRIDSTSTPEFVGYTSSCTDGIDNDRDGQTDGADTGCVDGDGDGLPNHLDNCPATANFGWNDVNGNGLGDACDSDIDGDGATNVQEASYGSDLYNAASTPEAREVTGSCLDTRDNDLDGLTDAQDLRCQSVAGLHAIRPGFDTTAFGGNDDGSVGPVSIGFTANFFGSSHDQLFVNNNGNVTFDQALSEYTPFDLKTTARAIIAPFFGDVDTRAGNVVRYGTGTVDGRPAFGVTWPGVGCYALITSVRNFFQVVLVDRSDVAPGDFDIEFNYDQIQWETGRASGGNAQCQGGASARAGFAKGTLEPGTFFELDGSGVPGAFLDTNTVTGLINRSLDSSLLGRYVFGVRNGTPQAIGDKDDDGALDQLDNCPFTPNAGQADVNFDGIGDACSPNQLEHTTAGFLQAEFDGSTTVEATSVRLGDEPPLAERLARIVQFRLDAGLATDAAELTEDLVHSLVESGLVQAGDADALEAAVIALLDSTPPVVTVTFPAPDGENGWFVHSPVAGTVTASDPSDVAALVCTGATVGTITGIGTPSASAPLTVSGGGEHEVSCTATDGIGNAGAGPGSSATATVKIDAGAPTVTCSASPSSLWPPDHGLVAVTTKVTVTDGVSGPDGFVLTSAKSSEPDNGLGDGDTAHDIQGWTIGTADTHGSLRAERSGTGTGRTYTLTYTGTDEAGNTDTCAVRVRVPHDQG
jgi:hypothetical protein